MRSSMILRASFMSRAWTSLSLMPPICVENTSAPSTVVVIEVTGRQTFVGSPATIAGQINQLVQADASDGFILVPHITPGGLDGFADTVVPLLQERGVFRTEYEGTTLRSHLGLDPLPTGQAGGKAVAS